MLFNSYIFIVAFLPVTLAVFFFLGRSGRRGPALGWLLAASLFFYGWWNPRDLPFLLASIALNYSLARALRLSRHERWRRGLAGCGIAANLLFLGYYKYAGFAAANLNALIGTDWPVSRRALPLAISFFTFQQIVFVVDAYRRRRTRSGALRYATGVAFFPHLLAGPIVRYSQLMPQLARRRILRPQPLMIAAGLTVFTIGLVKKVILADSLAQFVPVPFGAQYTYGRAQALTAWEHRRATAAASLLETPALAAQAVDALVTSFIGANPGVEFRIVLLPSSSCTRSSWRRSARMNSMPPPGSAAPSSRAPRLSRTPACTISGTRARSPTTWTPSRICCTFQAPCRAGSSARSPPTAGE